MRVLLSHKAVNPKSSSKPRSAKLCTPVDRNRHRDLSASWTNTRACTFSRLRCFGAPFRVPRAAGRFRFLHLWPHACCRCELGAPTCWGAAPPASRDDRSLDSARSRTLRALTGPSTSKRCCSTGPRAHHLPSGRARAFPCCCTRIARRHRPWRMRRPRWILSCPAASAG